MTAANVDADGTGQLTLAHMPVRLFGCTPSRLAAFDCPRRYRFTYVDRPPPPRGRPWAHNTVGATAHLALHKWWLLPRAHRTPDEGAGLVERNWQPVGFRDHVQSQRVCAATADTVRAYLEEHVDPADEPVGVERTVATRTERLAVSGRVDRIDDRDGELVVVDYKTGRRELDTDDARGSQALALYALAVRRTLRRSCSRVELHHLPTGTVAAFEHTDDSLQRHLNRAERTAQDIVVGHRHVGCGRRRRRRLPAQPDAGLRVVRLPAAVPGRSRGVGRPRPVGRAGRPELSAQDAAARSLASR